MSKEFVWSPNDLLNYSTIKNTKMETNPSTPSTPKNDPKTINAWAMFDWANSSYALVITTAIFPLYFNATVDESFTFLGLPMTNTALFSYSISFAYILIALSLPILSGIADYGGKKLSFMKFFTTLGSLACISLFFFTGMHNLWLGVLGFILAIIGFAGGQVFYNSYLPEIASEDKLDNVSAKGFAYGYVGSVILLIINLVIIQKPTWFGLDKIVEMGPTWLFGDSAATLAVRLAFIMVGLWWIGFAQISFRRLPDNQNNKPLDNILSKGYDELKSVWNAIQQQVNTKRFLLSFFCYSAGVQTTIYLASTFATDELKFDGTELIIVVLILQIVAIGGAYLFAKMSGIWGNKITLIIILFIWIGVCLSGYFVQTKTGFYAVAAAVGLVMGGVQSLSRSTYSKLIPLNTSETASYFSFYDVLEKTAIVLGTFVFGFVDQALGGMRNSMLALTIFFILGIVILFTVKMERKVEGVA